MDYTKLKDFVEQQPRWLMHLFLKCLANGSISEQDVLESQGLYLEELGLSSIAVDSEETLTIPSEEEDENERFHISKIHSIQYVNAIDDSAELNLGEKLNVVFGYNGAGKSSISRMLANIFTMKFKDNYDVFHDLRTDDCGDATLKLTLSDGKEITFKIGDQIPEKKHYYYFDFKQSSILIGSVNSFDIEPIGFDIFRKVQEAIKELEKGLADFRGEILRNRLDVSVFLDGESILKKALLDLEKTQNQLDEKNYKECCEALRTFNETSFENSQKTYGTLVSGRVETDIQDIRKDIVSLNEYSGRLISLESWVNGCSTELEDKLKFLDELWKIIESEMPSEITTLSVDMPKDWMKLLSIAKNIYDLGYNEEKCFFCQQDLDSQSKSAIGSYWLFLKQKAINDYGVTRKFLKNKELEIERIIEGIKGINSEHLLYKYFSEASIDVELFNKEIEEYKYKSKLSALQNEDLDLDELKGSIFTKIEQLNLLLSEKESKLLSQKKEQNDIETIYKYHSHRKKCSEEFDKISNYFESFSIVKKLQDTVGQLPYQKRAISTFAGNLFKEDFGKAYIEEFHKYCFLLGGENLGVTIKPKARDGGADKSVIFSRTDNLPEAVLSEGEKKIVSLADFLTEAKLDKGNFGLIFDDPVTSLDHINKDKIASIIFEASKDKQVIVFTHDIELLFELKQLSERDGQELTVHSVESFFNKSYIRDELPLEAQNLKSRKDVLTRKLAYIRQLEKEQDKEKIEDYNKSRAEFILLLRKARERGIEERLLCGVNLRFGNKIKPGKLDTIKGNIDKFEQYIGVVVDGFKDSSKYIHDGQVVSPRELPNASGLKQLFDKFLEFETDCKY